MIGSGELIVILCVVLILFGGKKLPEFARSLGQGIREFKKACSGECEDFAQTPTIETQTISKKESEDPASPKNE